MKPLKKKKEKEIQISFSGQKRKVGALVGMCHLMCSGVE